MNLSTDIYRLHSTFMISRILIENLRYPRDQDKAELLLLKPHPFICVRNLIYKKVGNRKN